MAAKKRKTTTRRRRRRAPKAKKRSRPRSKWGSRLKRAAAGAALGYLRGQTTALAPIVNKIPTIAGSEMLGFGGALIVFNDMLVKNKWFGMAGESALIVGAFEAGRGGFVNAPPIAQPDKDGNPVAQPALQGDGDLDDDDDLSGAV